MKKPKKKMNFKEWREFTNSMVAGIFGGFVILAWSLAYEIVKDKSLSWRIIAPTTTAVILFVFLIWFLRHLLLDKKYK
jgi:heme A synthase